MTEKTKIFLEDLKKSGKWNTQHDYSLVDYIDRNHKIIIINREFGTRHLVVPRFYKDNGLLGIRSAEDPTKFVIKEFKFVHGDRYDYSKFIYKNARTKGTIICKLHGPFQQESGVHKSGVGCPKCGVELTTESSRIGEKEILARIRNVHGDSIDLSQASIKNITDEILVIDKKYGTRHLLTPRSLISKKTKLGIRNAEDKNEYFIIRARQIHGDRYDYTLSNYTGAHEKLKIICSEHGEFFQTPSSHLSGKGCGKCSTSVLYSNEDIIELFIAKHGDKYDYSKIDYQGIKSTITIICPVHGEFKQRASNHLNGRGCQICNHGWNADRIIQFINNIDNRDILEMDPVELNVLISQGSLPKEFEELIFTLEGTGSNSLKILKQSLGIDVDSIIENNKSEEVKEILNDLLDREEESGIESIKLNEDLVVDEEIRSLGERKDAKGLPIISNEDILVLDRELINNCDDEAVEFFIQYKLRKVWNEVINKKRNPEEIKGLEGGANSSKLRDLFIKEHEELLNYIPPTGYSFKVNNQIAAPNMMQKLTVNRVRKYKRYGNWSGTGAGKTLSFIITSREIDSRLTVVVGLNSTIAQLNEDILDVYPDSIVHTYFNNQVFDDTKHNYLLMNYEKFQQGYSEEMFQNLNANNRVDFIVIDEVHNAKQRDKDESKRRKVLMRFIGRSAENNPNLHLLAMSATPVINNLNEAKSLLQLLTGKSYDDLNTRGTISNALKVFTQLLINGVRLIPEYDIKIHEKTGENTPELMIDGNSLMELLLENKNNDYLGLEKILIKLKLEHIKPFLKPKTIIYSYYTDNDKIPRLIADYLKGLGYSYCFYIGEQEVEEREKSKKSFIHGDVDFMIASRTIGTGVDGLQKVCSRMIIVSLPWTDSEYTQLKGRIYRQGSTFGEVDIIIPQVKIYLNSAEWSWDRQRLELIRQKRSLADAAVDGYIPKTKLPSISKLCSDSLLALKEWKNRVNRGDIRLIQREDLSFPLRPDIIEYLRPNLGDFSELNKKWSVSKSSNTQYRLKENRAEWYYYHELYRQKRKEWSEIPYLEIAKKINQRSDWVVADMGCGENLLAKEIPNKVYGFDYVACEPSVTECDISNVPLPDNSVDVVVYSLSLMGSNYIDYLKEGYRILKPFGLMFICEPQKKVSEKLDDYKIKLGDIGFNVTSVRNSLNKFIYIDCIKQ